MMQGDRQKCQLTKSSVRVSHRLTASAFDSSEPQNSFLFFHARCGTFAANLFISGTTSAVEVLLLLSWLLIIMRGVSLKSQHLLRWWWRKSGCRDEPLCVLCWRWIGAFECVCHPRCASVHHHLVRCQWMNQGVDGCLSQYKHSKNKSGSTYYAVLGTWHDMTRHVSFKGPVWEIACI